MRAEREIADIELIGMALIHGVGDAPIPENHYQVTTAISRPYVRAELNWVLGKQSLLQMYNYANKLGLEKVGRDTYRGHKPLIRLQNFVKIVTILVFILIILQCICFSLCLYVCKIFKRPPFSPSIMEEHS